MKGSQSFTNTIKAYLDNLASTDELFAVTYAKEGKNIDDCCTYIMNEVEKTGCNGFDDAEIFGMAVHYYDEEKIDIGSKSTNARAVVNHVVELTEDEKAQAKQKAIDKVTADAIAQMTKKKTPSKPPVQQTKTPDNVNQPNQQASLF